MKLLKELTEQQQGLPTIYFNEWDYQSGFGGWSGDDNGDPDETIQDTIAVAQDEWGVQGSEVAPGIWVGINFNDAEFEEDADEDGPYMYENMSGVLVIVTARPIPENHPIFAKAMKEFTTAAEEEMNEQREAQRDAAEFRRDPYSYYGVKRSDFF